KGIGWVLTNHKQTEVDDAFFRNLIKKAINTRSAFYKSDDTNAFRVFNGEGDGIGGLIIDYFAGYYLINWYSAGIYAYKTYIIQARSNWWSLTPFMKRNGSRIKERT